VRRGRELCFCSIGFIQQWAINAAYGAAAATTGRQAADFPLALAFLDFVGIGFKHADTAHFSTALWMAFAGKSTPATMAMVIVFR
jgi:hypothetical protein